MIASRSVLQKGLSACNYGGVICSSYNVVNSSFTIDNGIVPLGVI